MLLGVSTALSFDSRLPPLPVPLANSSPQSLHCRPPWPSASVLSRTDLQLLFPLLVCTAFPMPYHGRPMICRKITLPGTGSTHELARFDPRSQAGPIHLETLDQPAVESWLAPGDRVYDISRSDLRALHCGDYLFAVASTPTTATTLPADTERIYLALVACARDSGFPQLARFWNYVPDINRQGTAGEHYHRFCVGRAEAFDSLATAMPAATGIGSHDGTLRISMLAASERLTVKHVENPRQQSAYHYPKQYGPRSPSFARATVISHAETELTLLSGTSSIVHNETQHAGDVVLQIEETARNIEALVDLQRVQTLAARFYLRDPSALEVAQRAHGRQFPDTGSTTFLRADICRSDLEMEIEAVYFNHRRDPPKPRRAAR